MIKIEYTKEQLETYYKLIANTEAVKFKGKTFLEYYDLNWKVKLSVSLKEILCGDFEKLLEIKNQLSPKYKNHTGLKELFNYDKATSTNFTPLLSKLQPKISKFFEDSENKIEIHTCSFCNIEFINVFKTKDKQTKNGFTLDHLINKAEFPFLALSLYNLIPSCYICNSKLKGDYDIWKTESQLSKISPSSKDYAFDNKVKFKTFMKNPKLLLNKKDDFEILLKEDFTDDFQKYIEVFQLDGRYAYFKHFALEMYRKRQRYPDSRIKELAVLTKQTEEKVKQDLFGEVLYEDDLSRRSLAKFIKDLAKELGLI